MCLDGAWFEESIAREAQRNANGVSLKEAREELAYFDSTAYPVAEEMAEWLYKNWSIQKLLQLSPNRLTQLLDYIERDVDKKNVSKLRRICKKQPHN